VNGPFPNTESRGSATDPLDNVADYGGFDQTGIGDVSGGNVMAGYRARVTITRVGSAAPFASIPAPAGAVLQIDVRVSKAGTDDVVLTGYRFRYAPNSAG
jgi:MSHA pilin protein MshD